MFANYLSLVALVLASSPSHGAPVTERSSDISSCTVTAGGPLTAIAGNQYSGERISVGIAPGMTAQSVNDKQMSVLTTKTKAGQPVQSQVFEYARCSSIHTHNGETAHRNATHAVSFGLLRPVGSKKHCLAWAADSAALPAVKPGEVGSHSHPAAGARKVVDGVCGETPQQYRTWKMVEELSGKSVGGKYMLSLDGATPVVPDGAEGMSFYTQGASVPAGAKVVSLVLAS